MTQPATARVGRVAFSAVLLVLAGVFVTPTAVAAPIAPDSIPREWEAPGRPGEVDAVLVDPTTHDVFVVGTQTDSGYAVVAYGEDGQRKWVAGRASGQLYDLPQAAVLDPVTHRVYVTGYSTGPNDQGDYFTVAFAANGRVVWAATWEDVGDSPTFGGFDIAYGIAVDPGTHRVFVTGRGAHNQGRVATVAYDDTGTELWVKTYTADPKAGASGRSIAVDPRSHDLVVAGAQYRTSGSASDFLAIGYTADGRQRWVDRDTSGPQYGADAVAIDPVTGRAFVTGSNTQGQLTVAYDPQGRRVWTATLPGSEATGGQYLVVDPGTHQVYVVGQGQDPDGRRRFHTVSYSADGALLWRRYHGGNPTVGSTDSYPRAAALDPVSHTLYVTGGANSAGSFDSYDVATVAYTADGTRRWAARYGGDTDDVAYGVAVDPGHGVYVGGTVFRAHRATWLTIAYPDVAAR